MSSDLIGPRIDQPLAPTTICRISNAKSFCMLLKAIHVSDVDQTLLVSAFLLTPAPAMNVRRAGQMAGVWGSCKAIDFACCAHLLVLAPTEIMMKACQVLWGSGSGKGHDA